ncbi:acetyl-CoA carboxylase biotin carboxylase subunit (plasmid) [Limosilactobacillus reuteri]|uniref:Biotin carboxylase n=1 Tax=Limosilactobacillus reuteri TaxID=1598 RepID=A0A3M6SGT5_LIMRT|nr:acetyl-CoA carboxylase biotin carboxylase subunit [Limosilactobacillus reuteri]MRG90123.1 acetyl-CoA carboxylase biotin carboxylase subunit [Limosilactobacillus reuteri]RMX26570.1 acetyl-CoA carboxylase biotin carboxylase subunit [Limosilactobacillus reuteri]
MFSKVLVANRGEIAVRIIRTLHELGIKAVAIYSIVDQESLHVQLADEAVCVGGARPQDSYLNTTNILTAAIGTGAQAIHPGFGFLSENAEFARMCEKCGIVFIGPRAATIDLMGNKENARETMQKRGIPVIPGSNSYITNSYDAKRVADKIGYPILIKAAAGGGGKGIRRVVSPEQMKQEFNNAQREARISFGDDRMYLEKIMCDVKHIEVQVVRDRFGNSVYFPERDCSLQRDKQKIIEESPCSAINSEQRKILGEYAIKAIEAVDYLNTGTIEFLMDKNNKFYFMEMNTRIQVEHTVTEMVTGIDLVKVQLMIASGEELPFSQNNIKLSGVAIECRINAEDPKNNFVPSTGKINYLYLPVGNLGMRIDTALYSGEKITPFYDSMIAKVISHGHTRVEAINRMKRLMQELVIKGVKTNRDLHLSILGDSSFLKDTVTTEYLEKSFLPIWKEGEKNAAV